MTKEVLKERIESYLSRITYLNDCFELYKLMIRSRKQHFSEIDEFPAFYMLANKSFLYVCIIELAKLYERSEKSTGLQKLINVCDANRNLFLKKSCENIIGGMTGELDERRDVKKDISKDINDAQNELNGLSSIINKLKAQRDKFYAHLDKEYQDNIDGLISDYPLNYSEIKELIDTATSICNKFYVDLCDSSYVCQSSNWNDINKVFDIIKNYKAIKLERKID